MKNYKEQSQKKKMNYKEHFGFYNKNQPSIKFDRLPFLGKRKVYIVVYEYILCTFVEHATGTSGDEHGGGTKARGATFRSACLPVHT